MSDQKRRQFSRAEVSTLVRWRASFESKLVDISMGGLLMQTTTPPPIGMMLDLEFQLPGGKELLHATGKVQWVATYAENAPPHEPVNVGVEFVEISLDDRAAVTKYVNRHVTKTREYPRSQAEIPVEYMSSGKRYRGIATNLSPKGIFVMAAGGQDLPFELEDVLHLRFKVPGSFTVLHAKGIVRWCNSDVPDNLQTIVRRGVGVEFDNLPETDHRLIESFVLKNK